jgi:hypothetical protein
MTLSPEISLAFLLAFTSTILGLVWKMSALVSNLQRISDDLHELAGNVNKYMDETRGNIFDLRQRTAVLEAERKWGPH